MIKIEKLEKATQKTPRDREKNGKTVPCGLREAGVAPLRRRFPAT
jgi:hypothetical protein